MGDSVLPAAPIATLSADARLVIFRAGTWSQVFPVEQLPTQLAFYRALRDRVPAKGSLSTGYAQHYEGDVKALERVERLAKIMGAG
jgi:hypothetical protein